MAQPGGRASHVVLSPQSAAEPGAGGAGGRGRDASAGRRARGGDARGGALRQGRARHARRALHGGARAARGRGLLLADGCPPTPHAPRCAPGARGGAPAGTGRARTTRPDNTTRQPLAPLFSLGLRGVAQRTNEQGCMMLGMMGG